MKKLLLTFILILLPLVAYSQEEILLDIDENTVSEVSELENFSEEYDKSETFKGKVENIPDISKPQPITTENTKLFSGITKIAKDVYELEVEDTHKPSCLLKNYLTFDFEKGPVKDMHLWAVTQMRYGATISESGDTTNVFKVGLINVLLDGKLKSGKENFRIMLDPTPQETRPVIQNLFQDMYITSDRIPHHRILIGNSRPSVGHEGAGSAFTLPFINRSQISRNFGTVRKFGVRLMGDYSLLDYDLGAFSSSTYFTEFFSGGEFDGWINLKPLGKTDGRYGKLTIGGGIVAGSRSSTNYFVTSTYLGYSYKRFWMKAEYAAANGSNGLSGLTSKHRAGWYVTLGYKITKKLEAIIRYDDFNPDKNIRDNNTREYTAGINYYIKGQALKLILNYIFCQNQAGQDSHRILIGTQIAL